MCLCPLRGINQVCRGKRKSPDMSYTALGAPQPQDMVQMHCENPASSISLEKKGAGATEVLFGTTWYLSVLLQLSQPQ